MPALSFTAPTCSLRDGAARPHHERDAGALVPCTPRLYTVRMSQALVRPRSSRVIAGVCAAIANRFGWNVTIVRVLTVLAIFLFGAAIPVYIVLWIIIPQADTA